MLCPICEKRKAKRFCPARAESICSQCCGTEREVTIDCPSDCPHLVSSRQYDFERQEIDWSKAPFADIRLPAGVAREQADLIDALAYSICVYARDNRPVVDSDVQAAIESLAQAYRTLSSGIHYEQPPEYRHQREIYDILKRGIEDYGREKSREAGLVSVRDSEIRDALMFLAKLGFAYANGRPKGRAFLDRLRGQFKSEELAPRSSNIVLLS